MDDALSCEDRSVPPYGGRVDCARERVSEAVSGQYPALDVSVLPEEDAMPGTGHERLRYLNVNVLVRDERAKLEEVASVQDRLFPEQDEYPRIRSMDDEKSWSEVQSSMKNIRAARLQPKS